MADELRPWGVEALGICWGEPRGWDEGGSRIVPHEDGTRLVLTHDEREAPYALRPDGLEDTGLLVSLSDEDALATCAWARVTPDSQVVGLGIDLADPRDFAGARGERFNRLLFTHAEQGLVPALAPGGEALGYAYAFSAKEAAFKACAAPLRRWYEAHDEELVFDLRGFELADLRHEAGTARGGAAQAALDALGIRAIELFRTEVQGCACTVAWARA